MMKVIKRSLLIFAFIAFVGLLSEGSASASLYYYDGYVCTTWLQPGASNTGNYGMTTFTFYTGPDCTGDYVGTYYVCSTGATSSVCASNVSYPYYYLSMIAQEIHEAAEWNYHMQIQVGPCLVTNTWSCLWFPGFVAY